MADEAAGWLDDLDSLRERTRHDRHAFWLPMLLFGVLILAAPLVYRPPLVGNFSWPAVGYSPLDKFDNNHPFTMDSDPTVVGLYWLGAVVLGALLTLGWYHWRGRRTGIQPRTGVYLLGVLAGLICYDLPIPWLYDYGISQPKALYGGGALFLVGLVLGAACGYRRAGRPAPSPIRRAGVVLGVLLAMLGAGLLASQSVLHGYGPLLVIAVGLVALAWVERSRLCGVIAVLFVAAALLANLYDMENMFYRLFGAVTYGPVMSIFDNLLLPGSLLLVGGALGLLSGRKRAG